jgi:hypothetical protein
MEVLFETARDLLASKLENQKTSANRGATEDADFIILCLFVLVFPGGVGGCCRLQEITNQ